MAEAIKRMDIREFQEKGFLQEANRLFFHPHGLALEIVIEDGEYRLGGVWDYRDDAEGIVFGEKPDKDKAATVKAERLRHTVARVKLMGNPVQPLDCFPPIPKCAELPAGRVGDHAD